MSAVAAARHAGTAPAGACRIVVMGVSGCGKSTVGALLGQQLGADFLDGDSLHPAANITKMSAGIPLDDIDREPWLREIGRRLGEATGESPLIIACSALKRGYRDLIRAQAPGTVFIHLAGSFELLNERMAVREGHFMPAALLRSQFATLQELQDDEAGSVWDIAAQPQQLANQAASWLRDLDAAF